MEIDKMLTISAVHVTGETWDRLFNTICGGDDIDLCVYEKVEYGYFIHIPDDYEDREIPEDLMECIKFAVEHDCVWLCLDRDAGIIKEILTYE